MAARAPCRVQAPETPARVAFMSPAIYPAARRFSPMGGDLWGRFMPRAGYIRRHAARKPENNGEKRHAMRVVGTAKRRKAPVFRGFYGIALACYGQAQANGQAQAFTILWSSYSFYGQAQATRLFRPNAAFQVTRLFIPNAAF